MGIARYWSAVWRVAHKRPLLAGQWVGFSVLRWTYLALLLVPAVVMALLTMAHELAVWIAERTTVPLNRRFNKWQANLASETRALFPARKGPVA